MCYSFVPRRAVLLFSPTPPPQFHNSALPTESWLGSSPVCLLVIHLLPCMCAGGQGLLAPGRCRERAPR
eukprot:8969299-Pyramimonas_sp.AAC.1